VKEQDLNRPKQSGEQETSRLSSEGGEGNERRNRSAGEELRNKGESRTERRRTKPGEGERKKEKSGKELGEWEARGEAGTDARRKFWRGRENRIDGNETENR
jgi:hypothetical protein